MASRNASQWQPSGPPPEPAKYQHFQGRQYEPQNSSYHFQEERFKSATPNDRNQTLHGGPNFGAHVQPQAPGLPVPMPVPPAPNPPFHHQLPPPPSSFPLPPSSLPPPLSSLPPPPSSLPPPPSSLPPRPPVHPGRPVAPMAPPGAASGISNRGPPYPPLPRFPPPPPLPPPQHQEGQHMARGHMPNAQHPLPPFPPSPVANQQWQPMQDGHSVQSEQRNDRHHMPATSAPPLAPPHPPGQAAQWSAGAPNDSSGPAQWQHGTPSSFQQMEPPAKQPRFPPRPPAIRPYQSQRIRPQATDHRFSAPGNFQSKLPPAGFGTKPGGPEFSLDRTDLGEAKREKEESEDQKWVRNWVQGVQKTEEVQDARKKPAFKLGDAKNMLARFMHLLNELKVKRDEAADGLLKETDEGRWRLRCQQMKQQMVELSSLQDTVSKPEFVEGLKIQIQRRKRKRERSKRHRHEEWETRDREIKQQHERIDAKVAEALQIKQEKEQDEALQKEVDNTLSEVRKKKQDANKTMELLRALRKLRLLRKESTEKRGYTGPKELDLSFEQTVAGLEDMMNKQKLLYVEEERALQVMLEEEHEETREKERQKKQLREKQRAEKAWEEQLEILFGKTEVLQLGHPLFMFRQFHQQAEYDMQSLVNIRHQWDAFLVSEMDAAGSSVPVSWVMPSDPSNHIWATALEESSSGGS